MASKTLLDGLTATRLDGFRREEAFALAQIGCLGLVQDEPAQALMDLHQSVDSFRQMGFAGELGMALGGLALAQRWMGQEEQAWASLKVGIHIAIGAHSRFTLIALPAPVVVLLADAGRREQAVEAYTAVMTDPIVANSRWFADMVGDRMDRAIEQLPEEALLAAEVRGREGDVFDVLGRLAEEINSWDTVPSE